MSDELKGIAWITRESLDRLESGADVQAHVCKSLDTYPMVEYHRLVLRADAERLLTERDARIAELERALDEAIAETKRMRSAADELLEACDTSDGCCYGTLSTSFVMSVLGEPRTDRDALIAQLERERDEMKAALRECLLLAARHRHEEWAQHVMRLCAKGGVVPSPLRGE